MKKITTPLLTTLLLLIGSQSFAQGSGSATQISDTLTGYQNHYGNQNLRSSSSSTVLIAASPAHAVWLFDIEEKIETIGKHDVVTFNTTSATPTLEELQAYDAVFTFTDNEPNDPVAFGNVLAEYLESGGSVVDATFTANIPITGNWSPYELYMQCGQASDSFLGLGTIHQPDSYILTEVNTIDGGMASFHNAEGYVASGATVVAEWTDGSPLVITKENIGPMDARRAFINLYPPSSDSRADFWESSSDVAQLMSNTLEWAINAEALSTTTAQIETGVTIYPNPAQSSLTVSNPTDTTIHNAQIINIVGSVVKSFDLKNAMTSLNVSDLQTGVYFLKLTGDRASQSLRFIKN
ncbi:T9SS type A sorting domain-containing protein [uncultured Dokdonia sp.]|uniref:T9SS type A sorting domain-containing protein n=1 Tax=uncultured Dokdonia sp. TaxID=575653 RepID=UPI00261C7408|nr:T9SS type A sorting domain-containing protein [uncultured Dokdonia sp.]